MKRLSERTLRRRRAWSWLAAWAVIVGTGTVLVVTIQAWLFIPLLVTHVVVLNHALGLMSEAGDQSP